MGPLALSSQYHKRLCSALLGLKVGVAQQQGRVDNFNGGVSVMKNLLIDKISKYYLAIMTILYYIYQTYIWGNSVEDFYLGFFLIVLTTDFFINYLVNAIKKRKNLEIKNYKYFYAILSIVIASFIFIDIKFFNINKEIISLLSILMLFICIITKDYIFNQAK